MKIRVEKPRNLSEFVALIDKMQSKQKADLWFRGIGLMKNPLEPSLYRHPHRKVLKEMEKTEKDIIVRFKERSIPFHNRTFYDEWDLLFFMQHYGIPTRLLDWSENPFIGLYFALMSAIRNRKKTYSSSCVVWALNPALWNNSALSKQSYDKGILNSNDEQLKGYKPVPEYSSLPVYPLALFGAHNSGRIVAQRGTFVIFGKPGCSMEEVYETDSVFTKDCLIKIEIVANRIESLRDSLLKSGFTESVVFPGLDGLAAEINRIFGFRR
jgi:hypothetical protein